MEAFYSAPVLGFSVYAILWLFLICSFLGVVVETVFCLVQEGVLESTLGLLYLPFRPMYGIGGVACILLLHGFLKLPILILFLGMLICSVIEYIASLMMEKLFHTVTWDYSDKVLNLHGRICLQYSCGWGLLALLVVCVLDRFLLDFVDAFEGEGGQIVLTALMVLVLLSAVITSAALTRIRKRVASLKALKTDEAGTAINTRWNRLIDRLAPDLLMINTFPRTSLMIEFMELTGTQRAWIRVPKYAGLLRAAGHG